jgi:hypothetical protein
MAQRRELARDSRKHSFRVILETVGVENAAKPVIRGIVEDWRGGALGESESKQPGN